VPEAASVGGLSRLTIDFHFDGVSFPDIMDLRRSWRTRETMSSTPLAPGSFAIRGGNRSRLLTIRPMVRLQRYLPINLPRPVFPRAGFFIHLGI
jgi:hypothetical protein